jgi:prepilin-type processing-associated H-X9-DG protein
LWIIRHIQLASLALKNSAERPDAEPNGFAPLFVDGHVMMLPKTIKPEILSALFTRAGGELVNPDDLKP